MDLPQPFTLMVPVLAANLAAYLRDDGLPRTVNDVIVAVFFVLSVWASLYLGGSLTGNAIKDAAIVIVECLGVFQTLESVMSRSTARISSPLMALIPEARPGPLNAVSRQGMASRAVSSVPSRASALDPGRTWLASEPPQGGSVIAKPPGENDPAATSPMPAVKPVSSDTAAESTPPQG